MASRFCDDLRIMMMKHSYTVSDVAQLANICMYEVQAWYHGQSSPPHRERSAVLNLLDDPDTERNIARGHAYV